MVMYLHWVIWWRLKQDKSAHRSDTFPTERRISAVSFLGIFSTVQDPCFSTSSAANKYSLRFNKRKNEFQQEHSPQNRFNLQKISTNYADHEDPIWHYTESQHILFLLRSCKHIDFNKKHHYQFETNLETITIWLTLKVITPPIIFPHVPLLGGSSHLVCG